MFDSKTLFTMLSSGTDADTIAKDFSDALNEALKKQKEEEEKKKLSAESKTKKMKYVSDILGLACDLFDSYYPEIAFSEVFKDVDVEKFVDSLDKSYKYVTDLNDDDLAGEFDKLLNKLMF